MKEILKLVTEKIDQCDKKQIFLDEEKNKLRKEMAPPNKFTENDNKRAEVEREKIMLDTVSDYAATGEYKSVNQVCNAIHKDLIEMKLQAVEHDTNTISLNKDIKCLKDIQTQLNSKPVVDTTTEITDVPNIDFDDF